MLVFGKSRPVLGEAQRWRCQLRHQARYSAVNLSWLPDVILIAEQIDIRIDALHKSKECVWDAEVQ